MEVHEGGAGGGGGCRSTPPASQTRTPPRTGVKSIPHAAGGAHRRTRGGPPPAPGRGREQPGEGGRAPDPRLSPPPAHRGAPTLPSTTSFLTAAMLAYATGAGITAAAGTRLALQLILTAGFGYGIHCEAPPAREGEAVLLFLVAASPDRAGIGQFTRLLPALAVVAVFQAPSPESNPNSPLPVRATVVPCATVYG